MILGIIIAVVLLVVTPMLYGFIIRWIASKRNKESVPEEGSTAEPPPMPSQDVINAVINPGLSRGRLKASETYENNEMNAGETEVGNRPRRGALSRLSALPRLKRAIVWAEILQPPRGLEPRE